MRFSLLMSLYYLAIALQGVLVISALVGPTGRSASDEEAASQIGAATTKAEAPSDIAKLEAEVLAKFSAELPSVEVSAKAKHKQRLESLWLTNNNMDPLHPPDTSHVGASPDAATTTAPEPKTEGVDAISDTSTAAASSSTLKFARQDSGSSPAQTDVASLEAAVLAKYSTELPSVEATTVQEQPAAQSDVASLEAAVLAKYSTELPSVEATPVQDSIATSSASNTLLQKSASPEGATTIEDSSATRSASNTLLQKSASLEASSSSTALNVPQQNAASVATSNTPEDVAKLEAAVFEKFSTELPSVETSSASTSSSTLLQASRQDKSIELASTDKPTQQKQVSNDAKLDASPKTEESTSMKQADSATDAAAAKNIEPGSRQSQPVKESSVFAKASRSKVKPATVTSVGKDERKTPKGPKQAADARLAEELAAVEEVFHVSKSSDEQAESTSIWRRLSRFGVGFLCVVSIICIAVQKYDCFSRADDWKKHGLPKFKAKQEDVDWSPSCSEKTRRQSWEAAESILTSVVDSGRSVVDSGRRTLSRRSGADSAYVDSGV
mmetsp:Transcript_39368/g.62393  ORF Transcript_39368/g.62393 Transcript_39368/m.62393 type:complete len:556 (-) Transcript_39368:150-1817(-)